MTALHPTSSVHIKSISIGVEMGAIGYLGYNSIFKHVKVIVLNDYYSNMNHSPGTVAAVGIEWSHDGVTTWKRFPSLQWRHNGRDGVSNHQPHIVYSTVYSGANQRKHQRSASLAFVRGIHRWPVNSTPKWPVTWKMFPFADVIMIAGLCGDP